MSKPLTRDIKSNIKSGASVPATVVDVAFNKASVRLSGNGALMRKLEIVGGPISVGEKVKVDFTTPEPTIIAIGKQGLTAQDLEDWLKRRGDLQIGGTGLTQITICLYSEGALKSMYASTIEGLGTAIQDSAEGDIIWLPEVDLTGDVTLVPGTGLAGISKTQTILRGTVYAEPGCSLENMSVIKQENSSSTISAVQAQTTGSAGEKIKIINCDIRCYQCGSGTTQGVYIADTDTEVEVEHSKVIADSVSGLGYAFSKPAVANMQVTHTEYYAKTEVFHDL
jgi:hypothetical protein